MIASGGHPNPPVKQKIFWASLEGLVAAALLMGGGLIALQTAAILTAIPFCIILILMCYSLTKALRREKRARYTEE
jgi:choline/glycine/proline betaine transport protein